MNQEYVVLVKMASDINHAHVALIKITEHIKSLLLALNDRGYCQP